MMKECHYGHLDTEQKVLFCEFGGPCSKNIRLGDCWLLVGELKVGDWVEVTGPSRNGYADQNGLRFQINEMDSDGSYSGHDVLLWFPAPSLKKTQPPDQTIAEAREELRDLITDGLFTDINAKFGIQDVHNVAFAKDIKVLQERLAKIEAALRSV